MTRAKRKTPGQINDESIKQLKDWMTNNDGVPTILTQEQINLIKDSVKSIDELALEYMTSLKAITAIKNGTYDLNKRI